MRPAELARREASVLHVPIMAVHIPPPQGLRDHFLVKWVRARAIISPQIEISEKLRTRADPDAGAGALMRWRNCATKRLGEGGLKRAV